VLGLSGGIDSSLTAAIAADALGAEHVVGVAMPSEFSTSHSLEDALQLADNLGITCHQIPIKRAYSAYLDMLDDTFPTEPMSVAEENLQARIRGNILMFISNRFGHLVLVTGNKSEAAVGYATLYGDMAGGFGVLKDLLKRDVYALARWRNRDGAVIPESVLSKAPSAELRHDQKDEDSLPPYEVLDAILELYVEGDRSLADIVAAGYDPAVVEEVLRLVDRSEYKRRQAPPGIKVTAKAFGRDRRLPITNRWREGPAAGEEREAT
jgi:NAD+ synthase (glutamine-hydrolysing)